MEDIPKPTPMQNTFVPSDADYAAWADHWKDRVMVLAQECDKLKKERDDTRADLTKAIEMVDRLVGALEICDLEKEPELIMEAKQLKR